MRRKKRLQKLYVVSSIFFVVLLIELLVLSVLQLGLFHGGVRWPWSGSVDEVSPLTAKPVVPYLREEEVVVLEDATVLPLENVFFEYVRVIDSCSVHYEGECLLVRAGPGQEYQVLSRLRNDVVLKVGGKVERDGMVWYKIVFDEYLRYPERLVGEWYVSALNVEVLLDEGDKTVWDDGVATATEKYIIVDRSEQKLYAYDGEYLFMETFISTGLELTPTPRGTFTVYKKTPSRYMQGPLPGLADQQSYDLPGVPWNLYFTQEGAVIHGAYWHNSFGAPYSHGCVNMSPAEARELYAWTPLGTRVIVRD